MATSILTPIDFAQNELRHAVIQVLASAPSSPVAGQVYYDSTLNEFGYYNGSGWVYPGTGGGSGTVTTVSVVTANGFQGSVANATSTPAITLQTSVTSGSVLKSSSNSIVAATSGTDYAPATSGSSILKGNGSGGFSSAVSGTDYAPATSGSNALKGNGSGGFSNASINDLVSQTADYSANTHKITNVTDPTNPQDAATKNYVDGAIQGLQVKPTARAATTAALAANTYANGTAGVGATLTANSNGALASVDGVSLGQAVSQSITNVTNASTTVTATVSSTTGLAVGQAVTIAGITGFATNNPNGNFVVNTVPSGTTFTYIVISAPTGSYSSGGTATAAADIVLVKNESTTANNGLYTVTQVGTASLPYILTRHVDMDQSTEFDGAFIAVGNNGTVNANSLWLATPAEGSVTVGTTGITFTQLNGATDLIAGTGLSISGNTISLQTPVSVANGGTNATSASAARTSLGAPGLYNSGLTLGNGSSTSLTVTHNLNNSYPVVDVYNSSSQKIICDVTVSSANAISLGFSVAPASNSISCVVVG